MYFHRQSWLICLYRYASLTIGLSLLFHGISFAEIPPPRYRHTANLIRDRLYFVGGSYQGSGNPYYHDFFYLDLSSDFSTSSPPFVTNQTLGGFPGMDQSTSSVVMGNPAKIYVFGGWAEAAGLSFAPQSNTVYVIEVQDQQSTWSTLNPQAANNASWPSPRIIMKAVIDPNQRMYIWGGLSSSPGFHDAAMYTFNTGDGSWTSFTPSNAPLVRYAYTATLLSDGRIFYIGGKYINGTDADVNSILVYNTQKQSWSQQASTPPQAVNGRYDHTAVLAPDGHNIVIYGGQSDNAPKSMTTDTALVVLDTNTFTWTYPNAPNSPPSIPTAHTSTFYQNYMITAFGVRNGNTSSEIDVLDLSNNTYTWVRSFKPRAVTNPTSAQAQPPTPTQTQTQTPAASTSNVAPIVGGVVGGVVSILLLGAIGFIFYRRRYRYANPKSEEHLSEVVGTDNLSTVVKR